MSRVVRFLISRLVVTILVFGLITVLGQDAFLIPAAVNSLFQRKYPPIPDYINSSSIETPDGKKLEVWELTHKPPQPKGAAIIFHGNGENVFNSLGALEWLKEVGYSAYAFDYRGFGRSTGWPTESGLYVDADTVTSYVMQKESISAQQLLLFGNSFGTSIASYVAARISPRALILISPYKSIPDVMRDRAFFKYLVPFVRFELPTQKYLLNLKDTCLVMTHGTYDYVITVSHTQAMTKALEGRKNTWTIIDPIAGHNDAFWRNKEKIGSYLEKCE